VDSCSSSVSTKQANFIYQLFLHTQVQKIDFYDSICCPSCSSHLESLGFNIIQENSKEYFGVDPSCLF
jgi:hypothetical protein